MARNKLLPYTETTMLFVGGHRAGMNISAVLATMNDFGILRKKIRHEDFIAGLKVRHYDFVDLTEYKRA